MLTVPEVVEKIISRSPFFEDLLSQNLLNASSYARYIKKEIDAELMKDVQLGSIIMAIRRFALKNNRLKKKMNQLPEKIFSQFPEIIIRSNLIEETVLNSNLDILTEKQLLSLSGLNKEYFFTITHGVYETTLIFTQDIMKKVENILQKKIISKFTNLSSITIKLPATTVKNIGVYYRILKSLAWRGINVTEVVSTYTEFTVIIASDDVDKALQAFKADF